jgi:hypothetical protein
MQEINCSQYVTLIFYCRIHILHWYWCRENLREIWKIRRRPLMSSSFAIRNYWLYERPDLRVLIGFACAKFFCICKILAILWSYSLNRRLGAYLKRQSWVEIWIFEFFLLLESEGVEGARFWFLKSKYEQSIRLIFWAYLLELQEFKSF